MHDGVDLAFGVGQRDAPRGAVSASRGEGVEQRFGGKEGAGLAFPARPAQLIGERVVGAGHGKTFGGVIPPRRCRIAASIRCASAASSVGR